jgi:hypothetical protein
MVPVRPSLWFGLWQAGAILAAAMAVYVMGARKVLPRDFGHFGNMALFALVWGLSMFIAHLTVGDAAARKELRDQAKL